MNLPLSLPPGQAIYQAIKNCILSLLLSYLLTAVVLCAMAGLLLKITLSPAVEQIVLIATCILSTLFGGLLCGRKNESRKFLWGLLVGSLYFLTLSALRCKLGQDVPAGSSRFVTSLLYCLAGGMLGGMIS